MNNKFTKVLIASAVALMLGAGSTIVAADPDTPTTLAPGDTLTYDSGPTTLYLKPWLNHAQSTVGSIGTLDSYVYSGDTGINPGGLTFVYQLSNTDTGLTGITALILNGFAGVDVSVALGTYDYSAPATFSVINPDTLVRSDFVDDGGDRLTYLFSPGNTVGPPVFSFESSDELIVYTNALTYTTSDGVGAWYTFSSTANGGTATGSENDESLTGILTPVAPPPRVPDGGATAILLGLSLLPLGLTKKRR